MKKIIALILLIICMVCLFTGCGWNRQIIDLNYDYDTAMISFPDGTCETIAVKKWCDYEGEQIQIISKDGTVYLTHAENVVLINY